MSYFVSGMTSHHISIIEKHGGKSWDNGEKIPQDLEEGNSGNMMIGHDGDIMWQEKWDNRGIFNLYIYNFD
jgi:hypothetical protein